MYGSARMTPADTLFPEPAVLDITAELVVSLLGNGEPVPVNARRLIVENGLPKDARLVGASVEYPHLGPVLRLRFTSPSLAPGQRITPTVRTEPRA